MLELYSKYKSELIKAGILLIAFVTIYGIAIVRTNADCKIEQATAQIEGVQTYERTRQEVTGLPDTELDKRLSRWVRD